MERSPQVYVKPSSGVTSNDRGWEDFRENDVPCHHLPAGMQKKIHLADKVDSRQAKEIGFMNTHLPIARRSNGDTKQAVLLTLLPRASSLPNFLSDFCWICSALQWRDRAGFSPVFPIKPLWAPALLMKLCSSITECSTHEKSSLPRAKRHPYDIPFPSLVGSNGDIRQAVLLTLLPRYPSSRFLSDIIGFAPHYSGGTVPAFHRSSLLSPQGTFLFLFGCHYSITLDSCCQIDFATWYETGRFHNRRGHPVLACLCTRKHDFAKRDARDVLIHVLL